MGATVEELVTEAMTLPSESRARLADLLVESLDAADIGPIEQPGSPRQNAAETMCVPEESNQFPVKRHSGMCVIQSGNEIRLSS